MEIYAKLIVVLVKLQSVKSALNANIHVTHARARFIFVPLVMPTLQLIYTEINVFKTALTHFIKILRLSLVAPVYLLA
jgi:hypothetical protein